MDKIRVLHLELDGHLGGIESFLCNLYSEIDRHRIQFDFITRSDNPAKSFELRNLGANIIKISSYNHPLRYLKDLDKVIANGKYDVIHIHKNSAAVILPFIITKKHNNISVFVHSHNTQPSINGITSLLHRINRTFLYNNADEHFACSKVAGEWLYGKNREFSVLRNGIITSKYRFSEEKRKDKRQELNIPKDAFVVGNVGRFAEQKNQKRLVEIFEEIVKIKSNCFLILIGEGILKEKIQMYVNEKNIKNVKFLGVRNDIPDLMMAMDAFVMTSLYEGLPIVGVEAQAAGLDLYLSDTISKETELLDSVKWFGLNESNREIAEIIKFETITGDERKYRNEKVKNMGYDIKQTAEELLNKYGKYIK
ncbi:glycosyltransferase [Agathobacter sp.]